MKESIIAPKYAVLSSEEFWCHVVDPKTQRWIWERSAKFVDSPPPPTEREVLIELLFCKKRKFFAEFFWYWSTTWDEKDESMGQQYRTYVLLFVTAGILRAPSSDSYSWVSYGLFFASTSSSLRTAPVTWELLSSSRYGIAHSHKPFSSLCAFKICSRHPPVTSFL